MRPRPWLVAAFVSAAVLLAAAGLGEARTKKPSRVCHTRRHHRVCATVHVKPRRRGTTTTSTTTSTSTATATATSTTSATTTTAPSTTASQTTATQTSSTSSSPPPSLPHGTEIDERATGQASPFYALNANEHTFAAGSIHFNVYNFDQDPHSFAVADQSGHQLSDTVQVPAGHPGSAVSITVDLPPGTYTLFCTLPQHAADGMETTIVVK